MGLAVKRAPVIPTTEELDLLGNALELSQDDLGRMFGVSGESIRRWKTGAVNVPAESRARIAEAAAALERLQHIFTTTGLSQAIRRKVEAFQGESALDWILRGRLHDVADVYEFVLSYQA